jgi:hypothetical protein
MAWKGELPDTLYERNPSIPNFTYIWGHLYGTCVRLCIDCDRRAWATIFHIFVCFKIHITCAAKQSTQEICLKLACRKLSKHTNTHKQNWVANITLHNLKKKTPWSESASELYRPSDRRLSAKWLPTFADRVCHVVGVTDSYGHILGFLDRSRYFSIKQFLSCTHEAQWTPFQTNYFFPGSAGKRTRASGSVAKNSDH